MPPHDGDESFFHGNGEVEQMKDLEAATYGRTNTQSDGRRLLYSVIELREGGANTAYRGFELPIAESVFDRLESAIIITHWGSFGPDGTLDAAGTCAQIGAMKKGTFWLERRGRDVRSLEELSGF